MWGDFAPIRHTGNDGLIKNKTFLPQRAQRKERVRRGFCNGVNDTTGQVVDAGMKIHSALGPGLLEGAYEACLAHELRKRGLHVLTQHPLPVRYDGVLVEVGYRVDLLVEGEVIVELKAIAKVLPVHEAQLLSYLKMSGHKVGLLINFHVLRLKEGIRRIANNA